MFGVRRYLRHVREEAVDSYRSQVPRAEHLWRQVHLMFLECPECHAVVWKKWGARRHQEKFHEWLDQLVDELIERLEECEKRVGITEERVEIPGRWEAHPVHVEGFSALEGEPSG